MAKITVKEVAIKTIKVNGEDYIRVIEGTIDTAPSPL